MRSRWYFPGSLHQNVFDFLRLYCQHSTQLDDFARRYKEKHPHSSERYLQGLKIGLVGKQQLVDYFLEVSGGGGVSIGNPLARIYDALVYWDVFSELPLSATEMRFDFQINFMVVAQYQSKGVLENIVKGPGFLIPRCHLATVVIIVEKDNNESIGSGSVVSHNGSTFILTNRHVVNPAEGIRVTKVMLADKECSVLKDNFIISKSDDLAAFPISLPDDCPRFYLGEQTFPLQEVILLGFPKIPFTTQPHLTAHSGEINATIDTRMGEQLYLISNYASPGSSGGPLIDYRGLLVGVVSDRLEAEYEGEKTTHFQHSAAVTLDRVRRFIESEVLPTLNRNLN